MIIMIPSSHTSFEKWAVDLTRSLPKLIIPFPPKNSTDWWTWANSLISVNRLYGLTLSNKGNFPHEESWRDWASLFIQEVQSINFTA